MAPARGGFDLAATSNKLLDLSVVVPITAAASAAGLVYARRALSQYDLVALVKGFFTGPGRTSRALLALFLLTNLKNMPLSWTFRVLGAMLRHRLRLRRPLPVSALFHPAITTSHAPLLELDYNLHKSNSTYFSDLDTSRTHLVMHLLAPAVEAALHNGTSGLVRDADGRVVAGGFSVILGSVVCSFRREGAPFRGYEVWSRVLSWDRKWMYILSHFVVKGKVKPGSWDGASYWGQSGGLRKAKGKREEAMNGRDEHPEKWIIATALSKYVFKTGRFTIHPAIMLEASGLLPARPGEGWKGGESAVGTPDDLGDVDEAGEWDWRRVEWERRKGMEFAEHLAAFDRTHALFDGGEEGALGRFSPS